MLLGVYRGNVCTGLNLLGAALSLFIARFAYPHVTEWIAAHEVWMEYLVYFSEGSSHIPTAMMEYARADVTTLTAEQVLQVVESSGFPAPFDQVLLNNIADKVYAGQYNTLFDYFNQTVADYSLNTISFVLTFGFTYIVSSLRQRRGRSAGCGARLCVDDGAGDHGAAGDEHAADQPHHRNGRGLFAAGLFLSRQLVLRLDPRCRLNDKKTAHTVLFRVRS